MNRKLFHVRYLTHSQYSTLASLLGVLCIWMIFFARILFSDKVFFLDDLKIIFYPLEHVYRQAQAAGALPLWSNYFGFGQPLLGWGQLGFFTPVHVLLRWLHLPALILLQVSTVTYFAAGLIGMTLWLRRHRLSALAAVLGSTVFVFSGYNVGHMNHVNFYTATMVLPWLLLATDLLIEQVSTRRIALLSLIAAAIVLSGHPQASLYALGVAALYGLVALVHRIKTSAQKSTGAIAPALKIIGAAVVAALLGLALSSLFLLPLFEFLPLTERAGTLPSYELYEFSYVPWHAITLVAPYFFGDHTSYWGTKGFQELAAYVGVIPLLLAGFSLATWRQHRILHRTGLVLLVIGISLVLGKYSPLFRLLIERGWITRWAIPGRFAIFFTTGISLLAAVGFEGMRQYSSAPLRNRLMLLVFSMALPAALLSPLFWYIQTEPAAFYQLKRIILTPDVSVVLFGAGIIVFLAALWWDDRRLSQTPPVLLVILTALTLIIFGWDYNPLVARQQAMATPPFYNALAKYTATTGLPPRVYARSNIYYAEQEIRTFPTPIVSPTFSLFQPLPATPAQRVCFSIPMHSRPSQQGYLTISLRLHPLSQNLTSTKIRAMDVTSVPDQSVCLKLPTTAPGQTLYLGITSDNNSGINLYYRGWPQEKSLYLVRVANPTDKQLAQSHKLARLHFSSASPPPVDPDLLLLPRHLQVIANASSARWTGALSSAPVRHYIETYLAYDTDQLIDGDGRHFLELHRQQVNQAGITHLIQAVPPNAKDKLPELGFPIEAEETINGTSYRLYRNPQVYPKAYLADEAGNIIEKSSVLITAYTDQKIEVQTSSSAAGTLIINDSSTPQWRASVDGQEVDYRVAQGFYKSANVPAGQHAVSWRYSSRAVQQATIITAVAAIIALLMLINPKVSIYGKK